MVRTSKCILKYSNTSKLNKLDSLFELYEFELKHIINLILSGKLELKALMAAKQIPTKIIQHSQWKQILYKQASEIIRSNLKKTKNKTYKKYQKLYYNCKQNNRLPNFLSKRFSELNINYLKRMKINLKNITIPIDDRLLSSFEGTKQFDEFMRIRLPWFQDGKKRADYVNLPINYHKHYNKFQNWNRRKTIFLKKQNNNYFISFFFEKEETPVKDQGEILGIDLGYKKLITTSRGEFIGQSLEPIYVKLSKKKRGSKSYKKLLTHKRNEINRAVNELDLEKCNLLILEDLKSVKQNSKLGKKTNNKLQYWSYRQTIDKLERLRVEKGFHILYVDPAYTSQICSNCGELDKSNRKGEIYQCKNCGYEIDADHNGAINILRRGVYSLPSTERSDMGIYSSK